MGRFIFLSLGLLIVAFSPPGAEGSCPSDWLSKKGVCYKVFNDLKTWEDAETFCRKHKPGCHLASIHGSEESTDLAKYISDYLKNDLGVWIGLHDPEQKEKWEWADKSKTNYVAWEKGEPDHASNEEFCVHLRYASSEVEIISGGSEGVTSKEEPKLSYSCPEYLKWKDSNCENLSPFLCQCP